MAGDAKFSKIGIGTFVNKAFCNGSIGMRLVFVFIDFSRDRQHAIQSVHDRVFYQRNQLSVTATLPTRLLNRFHSPRVSFQLSMSCLFVQGLGITAMTHLTRNNVWGMKGGKLKGLLVASSALFSEKHSAEQAADKE